MSVCYLGITVGIHGLQIEDEKALDFLVDWIKEQTRAGLLGKNKDLFNFRNKFESDVEVEVFEHAGEFSSSKKHQNVVPIFMSKADSDTAKCIQKKLYEL